VDLELSRVILHAARPVGVALLARRGWTSRLAAMSILPDARGRGIGAVCVRQLLDEAKTRGDQSMTLEVIEQNEPAVRLYEKCGFAKMRRLLGFSGHS
jgi:ribosomal protein S18 acetylase RimI-like enzyme